MSATVERRGRVTMTNDLFLKRENPRFYYHVSSFTWEDTSWLSGLGVGMCDTR